MAFWLVVLVLFFVFLWSARMGSTIGAAGDDTDQPEIEKVENEIRGVLEEIFPGDQLDRYPVEPEAVIKLLNRIREEADAVKGKDDKRFKELKARARNIVKGDYLYVSGMRKLESGTIIVDVFITVGHKVQKSPGITGVMIERSVKVAISGPVVSLNDLENKVREKIGKEHSNSPVFVNPAIEKTLAPDPGKPEDTPAVVPEPPPPLGEPAPIPKPEPPETPEPPKPKITADQVRGKDLQELLRRRIWAKPADVWYIGGRSYSLSSYGKFFEKDDQKVRKAYLDLKRQLDSLPEDGEVSVESLQKIKTNLEIIIDAEDGLRKSKGGRAVGRLPDNSYRILLDYKKKIDGALPQPQGDSEIIEPLPELE